MPRIKEKKTKLFILSAIIVLFAAGSFYYQKNYLSRDGKPEYSVEVRIGKEMYARGEKIDFTVTNMGIKPAWYLVPPPKCKSDFSWGVLSGSEGSWDKADKYPKCEITKDDYDLVEIKTLNPGESIDGVWDQKLIQRDIGSRYAESGKHKVAFYYSNQVINKGDIGNGLELGMESSFSSEFGIGSDFFDDSAKTGIQKENDTERKNDLSEITKGLKAYYEEKEQKYPESSGFVKLNDRSSFIYEILSGYVQDEYLSDPNQSEYYYGYRSDGSSFELSARLENVDDGNCEIVGESLCIYKTDSSGNISQKKYVPSTVLTVEGPIDDFMLKTGMLDDPQDIIMITSDLVGSTEQVMIKEANVPENVRIIKSSKAERDELSKNNLVVIGSPATNEMINDIYRKTSLIEVADMVDFEKNSIRAAFRFAKNPWNENKNILVVDLGYTIEMFQRIQGNLKIEKNGEYYHLIFRSMGDGSYALVRSFERNESGIGNMDEFDGKNVEIYGYKRMKNSQEFPIEKSIGVIDISILD